MDKKIIALILVLGVLFLSGCSDNKGKTSKNNPFVGGTEGLVLSFQKGAPPEEVYDGKNFPFSVEVNLKNNGETNIKKEDVLIKIKGISPSDFGLLDSDFTKYPTDDIGATEKNPEGTITEGMENVVTFENFNYQGQIAGNTPFSIWAEVCYKYSTKAQVPEFCIKENVLSTVDKICKVDEQKTVFSSSAPVQITNFIEEPMGKGMLRFTFTIKHNEKGYVYKQGTKCDPNSRANENKVYVTVNTGLPGTECSGLSEGTATSGYVVLYGGEKVVWCRQPISATTDYTKAAEITLDYDYLDDISTSVTVKRSI
jgi:hypothetical protein